MQRGPQEPDMTIDEAFEIYNNYLTTLKDDLNRMAYNDELDDNYYLTVIRDINVVQKNMDEMQRQDVPLELFLQMIHAKVQSIFDNSPRKLVSPSFSPFATSEELSQRLSFYQLQGYNIQDVIEGVYDVLMADVDGETYGWLTAQFLDLLENHSIFQSDKRSREALQNQLNEIADLNDVRDVLETGIRIAVESLDKLPGKEKDEQLKELKPICKTFNDINEVEIAEEIRVLLKACNAEFSVDEHEQEKFNQLDSAGQLGFIANRDEFVLFAPKDKLYVIHVYRMLNHIKSFAEMKVLVNDLHKAIKASEGVFQNQLKRMSNSQSKFPENEWEVMERVLYTRDQKEVETALLKLSLSELKQLRKSVEYPTVIAMIDSVPLMKKHREAKFMRKRQVLLGYEPGRPNQRDEEDRSLKSKTEKGKYRAINRGKNLRKP